MAQSWPYPRHTAFEAILRQSNVRWFAERGYAVNKRMPYLLEHWEDWPKNIIQPEVADYILAEQIRHIDLRAGFPLHKYIHHGLSSQAMPVSNWEMRPVPPPASSSALATGSPASVQISWGSLGWMNLS